MNNLSAYQLARQYRTIMNRVLNYKDCKIPADDIRMLREMNLARDAMEDMVAAVLVEDKELTSQTDLPRCYIMGKIGGLPQGMYEANFAAVKRVVVAMGYEPLSPIDLPHDHDKTWASYMKEDIRAMLLCDAYYAMAGWEDSPGAVMEEQIARRLGLKSLVQSADQSSE